MDMNDVNKRTGEAIQRAAAELPEGYELTISIESYAGTVVLWIPPVSDEDGGRRIDDFCGDDFAYQIDNAISMAIEHAEEHKGYNVELSSAAKKLPTE